MPFMNVTQEAREHLEKYPNLDTRSKRALLERIQREIVDCEPTLSSMTKNLGADDEATQDLAFEMFQARLLQAQLLDDILGPGLWKASVIVRVAAGNHLQSWESEKPSASAAIDDAKSRIGLDTKGIGEDRTRIEMTITRS